MLLKLSLVMVRAPLTKLEAASLELKALTLMQKESWLEVQAAMKTVEVDIMTVEPKTIML